MSDKTWEVEISRDLVYGSAAGKPLLADLYMPRGTEGLAPAIMWLHGGGWRFGDRKLGPDLTRYFAQRGFAMVSIDYRLSDEAKFPAAVKDVKTAVRWLRAEAAHYGLDAGRIGLWGSSSGGHLAALAALSGRGAFEGQSGEYGAFSSDVQAVVDGYGPTDFLLMDEQRGLDGIRSDDPESVQLPKDLCSADLDSFESRFLGRAIETCPELVREANPNTYARPGAPPFLILHGLSDAAVPFQQSELLYEALAAYQNDATLCLISGLGHGFLNRNHLDDGPARQIEVRGRWLGKDGQGIFARIEEFFRESLGG
jgi:acetyl esterase/lipase